MTKSEQLGKVRKSNPKKMTKSDYRKKCDFIIEENDSTCQLCSENMGAEFHHSRFGCRGADKDDRSILLVCQECHLKCHREKHGLLNKRAIETGEENHSHFIVCS